MLLKTPLVTERGDRVAGPRHRGQRRDLLPFQSDPAASAAGRRARTARQPRRLPGPKGGSSSSSCNGPAGRCDEVFSYPMFRDLQRGAGRSSPISPRTAASASNVALPAVGPSVGRGMQVSGSYFPTFWALRTGGRPPVRSGESTRRSGGTRSSFSATNSGSPISAGDARRAGRSPRRQRAAADHRRRGAGRVPRARRSTCRPADLRADHRCTAVLFPRAGEGRFENRRELLGSISSRALGRTARGIRRARRWSRCTASILTEVEEPLHGRLRATDDPDASSSRGRCLIERRKPRTERPARDGRSRRPCSCCFVGHRRRPPDRVRQHREPAAGPLGRARVRDGCAASSVGASRRHLLGAACSPSRACWLVFGGAAPSDCSNRRSGRWASSGPLLPAVQSLEFVPLDAGTRTPCSFTGAVSARDGRAVRNLPGVPCAPRARP